MVNDLILGLYQANEQLMRLCAAAEAQGDAELARMCREHACETLRQIARLAGQRAQEAQVVS